MGVAESLGMSSRRLQGLDRVLQERYLDSGVEGYWDAALAASSGHVEQARALIDDPRAVELVPPPYGIRDWKKLARAVQAHA